MTNIPTGLKIIRFQAENIKKLTAVEISPEGNVVQITGRNGQGKTSVLDALWWVFTGAANIQSQPIRHGAETARIQVVLGAAGVVELVVERTFTEKASYLSVKTADGAKYPNPQRFMDDLLGSLTLDPLAFMRQKPAEQFNTLRGLVDLDIDPDKLDALNKADFDTRTERNRDARAKRTQAAAIIVPEGTPDEAVDEAALLDTITKAADENADIERRRANRVNAATVIAGNRDTVVRLRADAAKIIAQADALVVASDKLESDMKAAGPLPDPVDISAVRAELEAAQATNAAVAARKRWNAVTDEAVELEAQADVLTSNMEARTKIKLDAIAAAVMPVPGLSLGDGIVTFNNVPLDQASDAEQLTVSMSIAAAFNPKLRVLRVRDGSLLDDDAMKRMAAFADEKDLQIWVEIVGTGGVGFEMVDGHVKGQVIAPAVKAKQKTPVAAE
jgi:DNA repair exonuclease SbcCD ATPase subunit